MSQFYVKCSGDFVTRNEFNKFNAWCEWHDSKEMEYVKLRINSLDSMQDLLIKLNEGNSDCYYPLLEEKILPYREFIYLACEAVVLGSKKLFGYLSIVSNEVVSLSVWIDDDLVDLLRSDRITADEDNPLSIELIRNNLNINYFKEIQFSTDYINSDGVPIIGKLQLE